MARKKGILAALILLWLWAWTHTALSQSAPSETPPVQCTLQFELTGTIGPASLDLLQRAIKRARDKQCSSILALVNTPGGNLQTTRLMVEEILASPIPILCLVYPPGGHAGSAGAIILQACHVNGAMQATNLGAATPIAGGGQEIPEDLRKKLINDTVSWMEGITKLRGRNEKFSREIITEAKAVSAAEAAELGAIDFVAHRKQDFLQFAEGRSVKMSENAEAQVAVGDLQVMEHDLRHQILALLTDPQIAYLLFMGSLALLYFEFTNPGTMVAGVIGALGLVISLIALHMLEVEWGGLALLLLGIGLMVAEAFTATFGILGLGGVVAFVVGSLFLFDPAESGYSLPLSLVLPTAIGLGLITMAIAYLAFTTRGRRKAGAFDDLVGRTGPVVTLDEGSTRRGLMEVLGETWRFESEVDLALHDRVEVQGHEGLTLKVIPAKEM